MWTVHNLVPHDAVDARPHVDANRRLAKLCDYIFVHGETQKPVIARQLSISESRLWTLPHGSYSNYYPNFATPAGSRSRLGLPTSSFVVLFFGNIKRYKGIKELLRAFRRLKRRQPDAILVIAGGVLDEGAASMLAAAADSDRSIRVFADFVQDHEVQYFFKAADLVVLPYSRVLTSGVAVLALSFGTPVLAPDKGLLREYLADGPHHLFRNKRDLTRKLVKLAVDSGIAPAGRPTTDIESPVHLSWHRIVRQSPFPTLFGSPRPEPAIAAGQTLTAGTTRAVLYRILGNDLTPLHSEQQTLDNLEFILKNEDAFEGCRKVWILNRIANEKKLQRLIEMIEKYQQDYISVPFDWNEYQKVDFNFDLPPVPNILTSRSHRKTKSYHMVRYKCAILDHKNRYAINNNGARNVALRDGKQKAQWILPWDGNCFLTSAAWNSLTTAFEKAEHERYLIVPMERLSDNSSALEAGFVPDDPSEEPQIAIRADAEESFNDRYVYGHGPKVELLKRLGVPGKWDNWVDGVYMWQKDQHVPVARDANTWRYAGFALRLASGNRQATTDGDNRAMTRRDAIVAFLENLDRKSLFAGFDPDSLGTFDSRSMAAIRQGYGAEESIRSPLVSDLLAMAETFLKTPIHAVTDKTTLPPSGDLHDYWHPAPYAWPNPDTEDGLPYIHKDGERVPGTKLYEPESSRYDRSSLQRLFDETTTLSLAAYVTGRREFSEKAARQVRAWFIESKTKMNPHLRYAQVVRGRHNNRGTSSGIIETKDFYFFLDSVRLLKHLDAWSSYDDNALKEWLSEFLDFLLTSPQGTNESVSENNHGVAYDLQAYSIAAYLGKIDEMYQALLRCVGRMKAHFRHDGFQSHEMRRTTTAHYTAFNLQLWLNFANIVARTSTYDVTAYRADYSRESVGQRSNGIELGLRWLLPYYSQPWPFEQLDEFDPDRVPVLYHMGRRFFPSLSARVERAFPTAAKLKERYHPHDGIPIYWKLCLPDKQTDDD